MRCDAAGLANALDARPRRACAAASSQRPSRIYGSSWRPLLPRLDEGHCAHHLSWALLQSGGELEADELMTRCLPVLRQQAPWPRIAAALHSAGVVWLALGRLGSAEILSSEMLRIAPGASFRALYAMEGLALVAAESGDMQRALRLYEASVQARRRQDTEPEALGGTGWNRRRRVPGHGCRLRRRRLPSPMPVGCVESGWSRTRSAQGAARTDRGSMSAPPPSGPGSQQGSPQWPKSSPKG